MNRRRFFVTAAACLFVPVAPGAMAQAASVTVAEVRALFEQRDDSARRMVQQSLKAEGFYHGPVDGAWGAGTEAAYHALMASPRYQRHARGWTWSRDVQVMETMFFLTSDAYL